MIFPILPGNINQAKIVTETGSLFGSGSEPEPVVPTPTYISYYPSWSTSWFNAANAVDPTHRRIANQPEYFTDVMIAFSSTKLDFDKTAPDISKPKSGLDYPAASPTGHEALKADVAAAQAKGQKVLISIGGATFGKPDIADAWEDMYNEAVAVRTNGDSHISRANTPVMQSYIDFMEYFELDGVDLDFEDDPAWWDGHSVGTTRWQKYLDVYYHLLYFVRKAADKAGTTLGKSMETGTACWSSGWHATTDTNADSATPDPAHGLTSVWGGRAGRERAVFGGFTHPTLGVVNAQAFITKFINMSYDFGPLGEYADTSVALTSDVTYDPINVYKEAREIITDTDKVMTVGVCPEPFGWQANGCKMMIWDADCAPSGNHRTRLYRDGYNRIVDLPFSVESLATRFKALQATNGFTKDGFILWSAYKPAGSYIYNGKPSANATETSLQIARVLDLPGQDSTHILHL